MTEYQERIDGLLAACDKRQLAVMLLEARADAHEQARLLGMSAEREAALRAERDRLRDALEMIATVADEEADSNTTLLWIADYADKALAGGEGE